MLMSVMKKFNKRSVGLQAEVAAEKYLQRQGFSCLEKNYYSRFGEIDLIMQDGKTLVFVEVRCRADKAAVSALESITPAKMKKIRKTAEYYLLRYAEMPECRFDVIAMTHSSVKIGYTIDWIKNAF